MNVNEIKNIMKTAFETGINVILLGPPGVGKTVSAFELAEEISKNNNLPLLEHSDFRTLEEFMEKCPNGNCVLRVYIDVNSSLPVDISGIPEKLDGSATWLPMVYWVACKNARYCFVIFDEFNTTENPDMMALVMRALSECRVGGLHLGCGRKFTGIVAIGNPPEYSAIAKPVPEPIRGGKALVIDVDPPSIAEWIRWMENKYGREWDERVAGFLVANPQYFFQRPAEDDVYPTPRGWTKVALLSYRDPERIVAYAEGLVGPRAAAALKAFLDIVPASLDELLEDPKPEKVLVYAAIGNPCKDIENRSSDVAELLKKVGDYQGIPVAALFTFLVGHKCPKLMAKLYDLLPENVVKQIFSDRYVLTEEVVEEGKVSEIDEMLL